MSAAGWSLAALLLTIVLSIVSRINVGVLALALAWAVGALAAGMSADAIAGGFPVTLFLTLLGVTLLFSIAETNGTLAGLAARALPSSGETRLLLPAVFAGAAVISALGPGAVATTAFVAPLAMALGTRAGVSPFLMALAVANGANAGNLSPISSVGIIARDGMAKAGLVGYEWRAFFANFAAHVLVSVAAWLIFRRLRDASGAAEAVADESLGAPKLFTFAQKLTMFVVAAWIAGATVVGLPLGFSAFAAAAILLMARAGDEKRAFARLPLGIIVMVCGVSTLIAVLEKTGGMELFTSLLARVTTPGTVNGAIALVTGLISIYSSTSGVVMPAFLPTSSGLAQQLGGADALAIALSINVGSSLVDVSPLSTLGALCVAAVSEPETARKLFNKLLLWGFSMAVVGALLCQLFAGMLARI